MIRTVPLSLFDSDPDPDPDICRGLGMGVGIGIDVLFLNIVQLESLTVRIND